MRDVTAAVWRLVEAATVDQKWRELEATVRKGEAAVGAAFVAQGRVAVRAFAALRPYFVEGYRMPSPPAPLPGGEGGSRLDSLPRYLPLGWFGVGTSGGRLREAGPVPDDALNRAWAEISREMLALMLGPVININEMGLILGAGALAAQLGIDFEKAFSLKNPRAVAYLDAHGAALVTKINDETKSQMRTLLTQAADEGWSYTRTAQAIKEQFEGFAGLKPQKHIRDRATLVAVTEAGQAYEAGNQIVAKGLADVGIRMEKYWRTSGDERVSQGCKDNQAVGWIPLDELFPSGHERPMRFPSCRCYAKYRRAKGQAVRTQPAVAQAVNVARLQPFDVPRERVEINQESNPLYLASKAWAKNAPTEVQESILDWTKSGFAKVRYDIENGSITDKTQRILKAIEGAPETDGVIYRGLNLWEDDVNRMVAQYQQAVGTIVEWELPSSASYDVSVARSFGNVIFEFDAKTARNISALSDRVDEYESVIMPGTRFSVKSVGKSLVGGRESWIIQLEELLP